jgi:hypothetical protein
MKAVHLGRYFVDQFYLGSFEVMDSDSGLMVAQCSYFFDAVATDKEIAEDARLRAEAIAGALNLIEFNWKAPLLFE